jgi:hypothetical protein
MGKFIFRVEVEVKNEDGRNNAEWIAWLVKRFMEAHIGPTKFSQLVDKDDKNTEQPISE